MHISPLVILRKISLAAAGLFVLFAGCAAPPAAPDLIPATGAKSPAHIIVTEYPLVEQSMDSPTHAGFQQRVMEIVAEQRGAWHFPASADSLDGPNQTLAEFDYRLEPNADPPFSAYTLYHGSRVVQAGITRFWPVSLLENSGGQEPGFLLAFETLNGERLVASPSGVQSWSDQLPGEMPSGASPSGSDGATSDGAGSDGAGSDGAGPSAVQYQGKIAYAQPSDGAVRVIAGDEVLYAGLAAASGAEPADPAPNLQAWDMPGGKSHWALELDGRVILDGADFNRATGYEEIFHWQILNGQPFFFYIEEGQTYLYYGGSEQPYRYDQVVHASPHADGRFNPGSTHNLIWFYALRDGLWYYVEVRAE